MREGKGPAEATKLELLCGAEEACWAHNPKVDGSKPSRSTLIVSQWIISQVWLFPQIHIEIFINKEQNSLYVNSNKSPGFSFTTEVQMCHIHQYQF